MARTRVRLVAMTKLAALIHEAVGDRSVQQVADEWKVPQWVLRDVLIGKTRFPRIKYLLAIAKGLGKQVDELMDTPPEEEPRYAHGDGAAHGMSTATTS